MNGQTMTINGANAVRLGSGALTVLLNGRLLGQLMGMTVGGESVGAYKATTPFELLNGSGALGYRYGGTAGAGSYGAIHYFNGNMKIVGNLEVTGTITHN